MRVHETGSRVRSRLTAAIGFIVACVIWNSDPSRAEGTAVVDDPRTPETATNTPLDTELVDPRDLGPVVARIQWIGLHAFEASELEERIVTTAQPRLTLRFWKPKRRLDEFTLEEDRDRIVRAYHEIGYFSVQVATRVRDLTPDRVEIQFVIDEGRAVLLEAWTIDIVSPPDVAMPPTDAERAQLVQPVAALGNTPFGSEIYRRERTDLLRACGELGFPSARITGGAKVDPENAVAQVAWTLHLGPRTFMGKVEIEGLEWIGAEIVRRELRFSEGDQFSVSNLEESERRLIATGLFRSVTVSRLGIESHDGNDRLAIGIRVVEAPPRSFRASVG